MLLCCCRWDQTSFLLQNHIDKFSLQETARTRRWRRKLWTFRSGGFPRTATSSRSTTPSTWASCEHTCAISQSDTTSEISPNSPGFNPAPKKWFLTTAPPKPSRLSLSCFSFAFLPAPFRYHLPQQKYPSSSNIILPFTILVTLLGVSRYLC